MASPSRIESQPGPPDRRLYPAVLVALIVGIGLSVLGSWAVYRWEKERASLEFARSAGAIKESVAECLSHLSDNVRAVAALYEAFPERIGRDEFRSFIEPLVTRCDALVNINWAPTVTAQERPRFEAHAAREQRDYTIAEHDGAGRLVPAGERERYFPILYAEPQQVPAYPRGLDLASRPGEREAIEYVRRTGRMTFVRQEPEHHVRGMTLEVLFYPIFRAAGTPPAHAGAEELIGLVVGIAQLSSIMVEALEHAGRPPLRAEVFEVQPDGSRQLIYSHASASTTSASWLEAFLLSPAIEPREIPLVTENLALVIRVEPNAGAYPMRPGWLPFGIIVTGLLITGMLAVYLDRTWRRTERIAELARRLSEQDMRKNEFLAVLGHELRNPLVPIANAAQVLRARRPPSTAMVDWAADIIQRQVGQLARLIDDLLDVARISRGEVALREEYIDLREIVHDAVEMQRPLIDGRRHTLRQRIPDRAVFVRGDRARLVQVVGNLLDNAAKYTPEGGRIDVEITAEGGEAAVSVRDSGIGIPPGLLPRIFDLFNQAPDRDRHASGGGLGVGLGLSRRLIEMHGGHIEARSAGEGAGAQFIVRLPTSPAPAPTDAPPPRPVTGAASRRVLLVEDNPDVAQSFKILLETLGHQVALARDGAQALESARTLAPDIAFVDIGLPGMDGYEVARRLRGQGGRRPYLVALTGYGQTRDREQAALAGFDRHIVKPIGVEALEEVLAAVPAGDAQRD